VSEPFERTDVVLVIQEMLGPGELEQPSRRGSRADQDQPVAGHPGSFARSNQGVETRRIDEGQLAQVQEYRERLRRS
jgi:hypothetical protein